MGLLAGFMMLRCMVQVGEKVLPPTAFAVAAHGRGFRV